MKSLFFPISSIFPAFLGFWGHFLGSWAKCSDFQKFPLYLLLYPKRPSWSHGFNAKIGLTNGPPWAEKFSKPFFNMARQTKPQPHFVFSQISRPRVARFSNRFLHWNRGIEAVVLSSIRGKNGVLKNPKIFLRASKIASKTQNCRKTWTWLGKMAFHLGICDS